MQMAPSTSPTCSSPRRLEVLETLQHLCCPALAFDGENEACGKQCILDLEGAEKRQRRADGFPECFNGQHGETCARASMRCSVSPVLPVVKSFRPRSRTPCRKHPHKARPR